MRALYRKACQVEVVLGASCLLTTVLVLFVAAILRRVGRPINWGLDAALLLFTWAVFLGADIALREGKLVYVDFVVKALPEKARKLMALAMYALTYVFLIALVYHGARLSVLTRHRTFQGIPGLSYTWVTLSIPVCSVLMLISASIQVCRLLAGKPASDEQATP